MSETVCTKTLGQIFAFGPLFRAKNAKVGQKVGHEKCPIHAGFERFLGLWPTLPGFFRYYISGKNLYIISFSQKKVGKPGQDVF